MDSDEVIEYGQMVGRQRVLRRGFGGEFDAFYIYTIIKKL